MGLSSDIKAIHGGTEKMYNRSQLFAVKGNFSVKKRLEHTVSVLCALFSC